MTSTLQTKRSTCIRRGALGFFIVFALFCLPLSSEAQISETNFWLDIYDWHITSFDSEIIVDEDASFQVTETIEVFFNEEQHGIYREIPVKYKGELGNAVSIKFDLISVRQDGGPATYETYPSGANKVLKIGDAALMISGEHVYEITYEVERAILYHDDSDELYWNVTGNDWEVPILASSAAVALPDGAEVMDVACYTGIYGSTDQICEFAQEDNFVAFAAEDFLTIATSFSKGAVYEPTTAERILWFLQDNWLAALPLGIIIFVAVYWWRRGRDPRVDASVVAEYEAPDGIKAVYAGMLAFGRMKKEFLSAMIIQMAVDGYLEIKVEDQKGKKGRKGLKGIKLIQKKIPSDLDVSHQLLFEMLFNKKKTVELAKLKGTVTQTKMQALRRSIFDALVERGWYVKKSFFRSHAMLLFAGILGVLSVFTGAFFGLFVNMSFFFAALVVGIFAWFMPKPTRRGVELKRRVLGFKLFMHTAERYRSKWHEEENMFTRLLPYAIAFDDVNAWAKTFSGIEQKSPDWYISSQPFSVALFYVQFSSLQKAMTVATAPGTPSSGGGAGGGGFSGGGFGGGGGGSW